MGPAELASLGLSPPRVRIRIEDRAEPDEETQILAEIAIGRLDEDRGLFAQRVGGVDGSGEEAAESEEELSSEALSVDPLEGVEIP